ncbi:M20 family metallopeptidase [Sphingomonas sp. LY160]|uniref:M20 metallopeptidase family protein n=1 Tax=Sphingomonas sp. LY160 TaxID=3095342 RepID=UPI002ADEB820|nr:M20 family metallopeptidase [Sphingomonas sp. LY160]MEA1071964.1 M20 family metallopeptidase [Sphingomonas sp. LY160]
MATTFDDAALAEREPLIALRRAIHADPELGLDCPRTREKLLDALANLPMTIRRSERTTGFTATLDSGRPGRTVLLRGDMDALPIKEATGLEFASRTAGWMHACGHDTHSAMLATAARILCARRDRFDGRIVFMFQPGEEGHGGARIMLEEGLLGDPLPDAAFALHIWPTLPHGVVACRAGAMLASTDTLRARIVGRGGHAAMPHDALDPVPVAAEIVLALQSEVARRTPVTDPIVLSITKISGGTTHNVLPDAVDLLGTLRTLSPEARARGREAFERICTHIAAAHGCTAEVAVDPGYPPTVNDPRAAALVREIAGDRYEELGASNMGGEDFSYVLERVPGAMAFLGVAAPGEDAGRRPPLHNPGMTIDEDALPIGVALHCAFATRFLESGWDESC